MSKPRKLEELSPEMMLKELNRRFVRWQKKTERVRSLHVSMWVLAAVFLGIYGFWVTVAYNRTLMELDEQTALSNSGSAQAAAYREQLDTINSNLDSGIESYNLALGANLGLLDAYFEGGWAQYDRVLKDSRFYFYGARESFTQVIDALEKSGVREPGIDPFAPSAEGDPLGV